MVNDLLTVLLLVLLEGLLSADNAVVLAVLALRVPREQQSKVLRYGLLGAFVFRTVCIVSAVALLKFPGLRLAGGLYLCYLSLKHFWSKADGPSAPDATRPLFGLSLFWSTVVTIELTDIVFAIDSILVAVAMSNKLWVILTGGLLGLVAMRFVAGGFLRLIERYPTLVDGAYVVVAWIGAKLLVEYLHAVGVLEFEVPREWSIAIVFAIFGITLWLGRRQPKPTAAGLAEEAAIEALLKGEQTGEKGSEGVATAISTNVNVEKEREREQ